MSWLGTVAGGVWNFITGSPDIGKTVVDDVAKGIDYSVFTPQEKAELGKKSYDKWVELQGILAKSTTPTAINRRVFVWGILFMTSLLTLIAVVYIVRNEPTQVQAVIGIADAFGWRYAFAGAVALYFGPHIVAATADSIKSAKSN